MRYDAFSKCHPLTNFIFFVGAIGFSVVIQHPAYIAASCVGAGAYYLLLKGRKGLPMMLGLIPLFLLLAGVNPLLNTDGETVLFTVFGNPYTLEAFIYGLAVGGIFVAMMLWFGCYSVVLTSDKFTSLFGSLIPSLSLLLVMVLRMIPNLLRKARQIMGARKSIGKGAGEQGSNKKKIVDGMSILSALTDWALEGSIVTADSMRARGYGAAKRTSFQIYRMSPTDWMLLVVMIALSVVVLSSGGTTASYTPSLEIAPLSVGFVTYCGFLLIPIALHIKEALQWHISISKI